MEDALETKEAKDIQITFAQKVSHERELFQVTRKGEVLKSELGEWVYVRNVVVLA